MNQSLAERPCEQGFDHQCKWCHIRLSSPTPPKEHEPTPDWENARQQIIDDILAYGRGVGQLTHIVERLDMAVRHTIAEAVRERDKEILASIEKWKSEGRDEHDLWAMNNWLTGSSPLIPPQEKV